MKGQENKNVFMPKRMGVGRFTEGGACVGRCDEGSAAASLKRLAQTRNEGVCMVAE